MHIIFHSKCRLLVIVLYIVALVSSTSFAAGNAEGGLEGFRVGTRVSLADLPRVTQILVVPPFLP